MKKLDGWRTSVLSPVVAAVVKIAIHAKEVGCFSPTGYIIIQRHSGIFSEIRICKSLQFRLIRIRHCFCWCCSWLKNLCYTFLQIIVFTSLSGRRCAENELLMAVTRSVSKYSKQQKHANVCVWLKQQNKQQNNKKTAQHK